MSQGALLAMQHAPAGGVPTAAQLQQLATAHDDLVARSDSAGSALSQASAGLEAPAPAPAPAPAALRMQGSSSLEFDGSAALPPGLPREQPAAPAGEAPKKEDAKSMALKALAGVSAIVSKSRKVDAEALHTIKLQRAKARAEGHHPGSAALSTAASGSVPAPARGLPLDGPGLSPFASATSQGMGRTPSSSNLAALHGHATHGALPLGHATSLPATVLQRAPARRSPTATPPSDYESLVGQLSIAELLALKAAVEGQLGQQAAALAALTGAPPPPPPDALGQQYAALLLQQAQQAQQAQLARQLSAAQQAATAAAIQQALAAAAFPADGQLLGQPSGAPGLAQYSSMPAPGDMASPFACAPLPPEPPAGLGEAAARAGSLGLPPQRAGAASGGSPRSASVEQRLIGEALHSFLDPQQRGPPSRQGSALPGGLGWGDRRPSGAPGGAPAPPQAPPPGAAFSRSRSLPPHEPLYGDHAVHHASLLADGEAGQLAPMFSGLRLEASGEAGGPPPSAFALASRSGSLHVPLPPHAPYPDNLHLHYGAHHGH